MSIAYHDGQIILDDMKWIQDNFDKAPFEGTQVLVTGGAGFLGSWCSEALLGLGAHVTCLDNLSTGLPENIEHLVLAPAFRFEQKDVCNFKTTKRFDMILHMASHASPEHYQHNPISTLEANSTGSQNILEVARRCDATVMFASTSEVYGDALIIPTPEDYWGNVNPVGPRSCYDEGKRFGEALFTAYNREYGLNVKIARIFNSYGPRIRADGLYGRAVPRFILQALNNQPITVYGDGQQTRSFCYVSDTILGLLRLTTSKKASGEPVNIGNPNEITILTLAKTVKAIAKSTSPIVFRSLPEDDPKRRCPEMSKAKKFLEWHPKMNLKKGLQRTINWFRSRRSPLQQVQQLPNYA